MELLESTMVLNWQHQQNLATLFAGSTEPDAETKNMANLAFSVGSAWEYLMQNPEEIQEIRDSIASYIQRCSIKEQEHALIQLDEDTEKDMNQS